MATVYLAEARTPKTCGDGAQGARSAPVSTRARERGGAWRGRERTLGGTWRDRRPQVVAFEQLAVSGRHEV